MGPTVSSKSAESFGFLTQAIWATEVVTAASQIGVLTRLESGPVTPDALGTDLGIDRSYCRLLMTALVGLGLADREEGGFRSAVPGLTGVASRLIGNGRLTESLSNRKPVISAETPNGSAHLYPKMVRYLASGFQDASTKAADRLAQPGLTVLDLGAGAAPWSLAIVAKCPDVRVVAIDLPEVIPATNAAIAEAGLEDRFELRHGDLFDADLEAGRYDLVIAGGICHLFDEPANMALLRLAHRAMAPNGTLAILEPLINEDLDGPRAVILYALDLSTRTHGGGVRPFSTYVSLLKAGGLNAIERADLSASPPMSLITATKPE